MTVKTKDGLLVDNPSFSINGGSHAHGSTVNYCDIKIVKVEANVNNRATFHLFTDVPIPSLWRGVVLDDMIPQTNPDSTLYTELLGVPKMPVGIYDFRSNKLTDVTTDVSYTITVRFSCKYHRLSVSLTAPFPVRSQAQWLFRSFCSRKS